MNWQYLNQKSPSVYDDHHHNHQIIITASPLALTSHHPTQHDQHHALLVNVLVLRPLLKGRLERVSHVLWRNEI